MPTAPNPTSYFRLGPQQLTAPPPATAVAVPLEGGGGGAPVPVPIPYPPTGPLYPILTDLFQGKPREAATYEIARVLEHNPNPVLANLGKEFRRDVQNFDAVLSSPADVRNRFAPELKAARAELTAEGFTPAQTAYLTKAVYGSGGHLTAGELRGFDNPPNVASAQPPPSPIAPIYSGPIRSPLDNQLLGEATGGAIGEQIGGVKGAIVGSQVGKIVGGFINSADDFANQLSLQTASRITGRPISNGLVRQSTRPGGVAVPQPGGVPHVDLNIPCASCGDLSHQEGELEEELLTESQQDVAQKTRDREQEIQQLRELEKQPAETRNIPQEIARKKQLLADVQAQEYQLRQQENEPNQPGQMLPHQPGQPAPTLEPLPAPQPAPQPAHQEPTRLCLMCESPQEAMKFLNGQPASCVVEEN